MLERNFVRRIGEIDLVCREPCSGLIVFIEVRYRRNDAFGGGLESVDARKQAKLRRTALAWLQQRAHEHCCARFDVIAVGPDTTSPPARALSGDTPCVVWNGLRILWIKNAL